MSRVINLIIYALVLIIAGCASRGSHTINGNKITNIQESLSKGEIRLTCNTACSYTWGANRREMKLLYENELWEDLASTVARIGFRSDQTYYYLGRSAEGLGYIDASRKYYKLAKSSFKCDGVFNNCDGLVFPLMLDERLKIVAPEIIETAPLKISPKPILDTLNKHISRELYRNSQPGDSGKYYIVERQDLEDGLIEVLSSRVGKNNAYTDFTLLKVNCTSFEYIELGGLSEDNLKVTPSKPIKPWKNTKWTSLINGSSKSDLVKYVCKTKME